jgi:phosphoenolpyruvate-protein kinase (PTS system EI component)
MLPGVPASPGIGHGRLWRLGADEAGAAGAAGRARTVPVTEREAEADHALAALAGASDALQAVASTLPRDEAEIVEAGALMAQDPGLAAAVRAAIINDGLGAAAAILHATGAYAQVIAAVDDELLAARADDVRSLGRRAAALAGAAAQQVMPPTDNGPLILLARELGPADVAELADRLAGIALIAGSPTAHAAIVARSLGVPMVTGLADPGADACDLRDAVLDGTVGSVVLDPTPDRRAAAGRAMARRRAALARMRADRDLPAVTRDGVRVTVLANVASPAELDVAVREGAEGIGLLRTELAFLEAARWPTEEEHAAAVRPILAGLGGRPAVVRVLDFGADKSPPFLGRIPERGIELLLAHRDGFIAQLRGILAASAGHDVRLLLPMVDTPEQVEATRGILERAARQLGIDRTPPLGAMIETRAAVHAAGAIAAVSAFLSIGTNDLTAAILGTDRFAGGGARAHDPLVLRAIGSAVAAAHGVGIPIEVCGEAASDPVMVPLLVGLGLDELSVGAARVGALRSWVRGLDAGELAGLARSAQTMDDADEVEEAVRPLALEITGEIVTR